MDTMMMGNLEIAKIVMLNVLNASKKQIIVLSVHLESKIHQTAIVLPVNIHLRRNQPARVVLIIV
jgi:hypothetical protein